MNANRDAWTRKKKGSALGGAWIHKHPELPHAIVENTLGVKYRGEQYRSVAAAKKAAMAELEAIKHPVVDEETVAPITLIP